MNKPKVSVAIATFNEEKNIVDCILSAKNITDEIIVVDGNSSDRTAEIALKTGAKVIKTSNKSMFNINKNMAIDNCSGKWVFLLDADEIISPGLAGEVIDLVNTNPEENGFFINRKNWFLGGFLKKGGAYPDSVIRLFRKGKGRLPEKDVHEQVKIDGKIGNLNNDLIHLADPAFERYLRRAIRYTDRTAINFETEKIPINMFTIVYYMLIKPFTTFLALFFRHKGYQDGFRGFIWALFSGAHFYYAFVKYMSQKK